MDNKTHLPIFGIGPIYVITCFILMVFALILDYKGLLKSGNIIVGKIFIIILGIILIVVGVILWIQSVIIQKISDKIKKDCLVTDGVYSIVRNPIYSAFTFIFSGILFTRSNLFLFSIPFIFYIYLTILMKLTEEKWLRQKFGDDYVQYCKKVNRVIPYFRQK